MLKNASLGDSERGSNGRGGFLGLKHRGGEAYERLEKKEILFQTQEGKNGCEAREGVFRSEPEGFGRRSLEDVLKDSRKIVFGIEREVLKGKSVLEVYRPVKIGKPPLLGSEIQNKIEFNDSTNLGKRQGLHLIGPSGGFSEKERGADDISMSLELSSKKLSRIERDKSDEKVRLKYATVLFKQNPEKAFEGSLDHILKSSRKVVPRILECKTQALVAQNESRSLETESCKPEDESQYSRNKKSGIDC